MIYSLKTTIKAALKWEQIHRNIIFNEWTDEKKWMNYYGSELLIQSLKTSIHMLSKQQLLQY